VNTATFLLTIENTGAGANDGSAANTFSVGAITGTTGGVTIRSNTNAPLLTTTVASINLTGAAPVTVTNQNANDATVNATVTGNLSTGGALNVINTEAAGGAADRAVSLTVGGNTTVTGLTTITAGVGAAADAANSTLTVTGNATFTGGVALNGVANADSGEALLVLSGASINLGTGLTMTDNQAGQTSVVLNGTAAQIVTGNIGGDGELLATGIGATFLGTTDVDAFRLEAAAATDVAATFRNTADAGAGGFVFQGGGTGNKVLTFDGQDQAFTVTGALTGAAAGGTDTVNFVGGNVITVATATAATDNINFVNVTGTGTVASVGGANFQADALSVGTGAAFRVTGNTADINTITLASNGTLDIDGGNVTGSILGAGNGTGVIDIDTAGTSTITGSVGSATNGVASIDIAEGSTALVTGDVFATATNFSGTTSGTFQINAGADLTGNVTTTTNGNGTFSILNGAATSRIAGNIGTDGARLATVSVIGVGATTVDFTGNVFANALTASAADQIRFVGVGNAAQTVSGVFTSGGGATDVFIGNDTTSTPTVTFLDTVGVGGTALVDLNVETGSTANFQNTATFSGATTVDAGSTVRVGASRVFTTGTIANTGSLTLDVNDTDGTLALADIGQVVNGAANTAFGNIHFNVLSNLGTGTAVVNITDVLTGGGTAATLGTITDNSLLYSFNLTPDGAGDVDLAVSRAALANVGVDANDRSSGRVLDTLRGNANAQMVAFQNRIASAPTGEALSEVIESATPTVDGAATLGGFNASVQAIDVTNTRLASIRSGSAGETGMVAGNMGEGVSFWMQGFGQMAQQDERDNINGFDADTYGVAVGMDTSNIHDGATLGLSLSYADTQVDSENANRTSTDVDSFQITAYGDFDVAPETYVSTMLAYAYNDIDQTRSNVGGAGLTANANFDSSQFIAYAEAGRDYQVGAKATFTPSVLAHYQHISVDDYSETGTAGGLLLQNVDTDSLNIFELGLGGEVSWDLMTDNGMMVQPALNAGYRYDVIGDNVETTSRFNAGGAAFNTQGFDPAQSTFNVGASVMLAADNNWEFTADYDYEFKSDFDAHSGSIRASYKF
jgi:outer membrane autotransporter protein